MKALLTSIALGLALSGAASASPPQRVMSYGDLDPAALSGLVKTNGAETGRTMVGPARQVSKPGLPGLSAPRGAARNPEPKSLSGARFYGWLTTPSSGDMSGGWYSLDADGEYKMQWTNQIVSLGINLTSGWIKNDRLCGLGSFSASGLVFYYNYLEFDLKTGEPLTETPIGADNLIDMSTYYLLSVYVPSEDRIYGYTYTDNACSGYRFCSSPADDIGDVTVIRNLTDFAERTSSICYNPEDDMFYGVNYSGDFVRIDRKGTETALFHLPLETLRSEPSGLIWSPLDGCFIYSAYYFSYATQLYAIYPETKEVRFIRNFPTDLEFTFLLDPDSDYDPKAPGRPALTGYDVVPGALSGEVTYRLPDKLGDGSALTGELGWTLYIDNAVYKTGKGTAGSEVKVALSDIAQGTHVLRFAASSGKAEGLSCVVRKYFGNGVPLAPASVTLSDSKISWEPVTEAELGAYLDLSKLQYDVYLNDRYLGSTSGTEYASNLDPALQVDVYHAYVSAKCNGLQSERAESNKLIYGAPIPLPYSITPTQEQFDLCHVINADGGPAYGVWDFSESRWHEPVFFSGWGKETADDWLILPPVDCTDLSHAYRITFDAICGGTTSDTESFEVWCGAAPTVEAMKTLIMPKTSVDKFITEGWETFSNLFVPAESGPCYIAIRCVSPPEQYSLIIRKILIETTDEVADIPAAPEALGLVSKSDADLTATVTFRLPLQTISGAQIPENAEVKAMVRSGAGTAEKTAKPGETVTLTVGTAQGDNRVEAYCSVNGQGGQVASISVFTGTIPPNYVENFKAQVTEDNLGIRLTWSAPLGGQENLEGYYSPEGMHYWLYEQVYDPTWGESTWQPVKDLGNVTEYTYTVPADDPLRIRYLGISAANNGGISDALSYALRVVGKPYASISEDFADGQPHYSPLRIVAASTEYVDAAWEIVLPEQVNSDAWSAKIPFALIGYSDNEAGGRARVALPKVVTAGMDRPVLAMTVWTGKGSGKLSAYAAGYSNQNRPEKIFDMPAGNGGWTTVMTDLPSAYCDKQWVEIQLDAELSDYYDFVMIGGYKICPAAESAVADLAQPATAIAGGRGELIAVGFAGEEIRVYGADGSLAAAAVSDGDMARLRLAPGLYLVRIGSRQAKVLVR